MRALFRSAHFAGSYPAFDIKRAPGLQAYGRMLIVIPRKVGNAPQRNLIRRRLKSIFYEEKLYEQPYDWLLFIKPTATAIDFQTLKQYLLAAMPLSHDA
jgi:ribonuclease P protein component